ncbi:hypothetical protein Glove_682g28 [Diversispora epigaea]|uniref:Uncharacterized protein n=1 Tax=Diversispora epigaea TaxID=1348612 RepID=A0A397G2K8_9GLOM|nr:hypothetical protein Glove_682g28 [Diversispora epigaea]
MSFLQKNLFKGKIEHTPNADNQNNGNDENDENNEINEIFEEIIDEEEEGKSGISTMSTTFIKPRRRKNYSIVSWETCFDRCRDIKIPNSENISFLRILKTEKKIGVNNNCLSILDS